MPDLPLVTLVTAALAVTLAYTVFGLTGFGAAIVERIEGDFFAVMGLPVGRMLALLRAAGWRYNFQRLERGQ